MDLQNSILGDAKRWSTKITQQQQAQIILEYQIDTVKKNILFLGRLGEFEGFCQTAAEGPWPKPSPLPSPPLPPPQFVS